MIFPIFRLQAIAPTCLRLARITSVRSGPDYSPRSLAGLIPALRSSLVRDVQVCNRLKGLEDGRRHHAILPTWPISALCAQQACYLDAMRCIDTCSAIGNLRHQTMLVWRMSALRRAARLAPTLCSGCTSCLRAPGISVRELVGVKLSFFAGSTCINFMIVYHGVVSAVVSRR